MASKGARGGAPRMTIYELARRAKVSTATVSRALHGDPLVNPRTRETITALARELDYRPSAIAARLSHGRTGMIGLVLPSPDNPFYAALARAVLEAAEDARFEVLIQFCGPTVEREDRILESVRNLHVDGVIMEIRNWSLHRKVVVELARARPLVLRRWVEADVAIDTVTPDFGAAAEEAVLHLLNLGHRRIGFVGAPDAERTPGIRAALARFGMALRPRDVVACGPSIEEAYAGARAALEAPERPTALVVHNDYFAFGALRAAAERGLRVPADISVIAFDGVDLGAYGYVPLTSMALPAEDTARALVECLGARIGDATRAPERRRMPMHLVDRGSTGTAPQA